MAEAIVFKMAGNILSDLSSHTVQRIASAIGVQRELNKLERTLSTVNAVLMDVDEQQLINNHLLERWVKNIKDACYEVEDVLDDFATESLRRELWIRDSTFRKVWNFAYSFKSVLFRFKMSHKIMEIQEKFREISDNRKNFFLVTRVVDIGVQNRWREQNYSFVNESEVFGRDDDKKTIIDLLLGRDEESVIAIVGMGGMGKTTLAQLVYDDKEISQVYKMKMWVGVYQDFDVKKILEMIIRSATKKECPNLDIDQLRSLLQEQVKGKKFLLVLDDVWNKDSKKWNRLKFLISSGARGSKVVITTRNKQVATIMGAVEPHILKELSSDDCWNVFEKSAFAGRKGQADPKVVAIGKEIVKRCHGVPLAAMTLGGLMFHKSTHREWEDVRDSDIWKLSQNETDIMPVLRLSYNHLPFYLKQCFAYLASFEKDSLYEKNHLIRSWIAHGFIRLSQGDSRLLENLGSEYIKELLWRSLIQESSNHKCDHIHFKVHNLVYDLAKDVAGTEYFCFEEGIKVFKPEEIRYAELEKCSDSEVKEFLRYMPNLRELGVKCAFPVKDIFSRLKRLRWLRIQITDQLFLSSIGKLKHLRELHVCSDTMETPLDLLPDC